MSARQVRAETFAPKQGCVYYAILLGVFNLAIGQDHTIRLRGHQLD